MPFQARERHQGRKPQGPSWRTFSRHQSSSSAARSALRRALFLVSLLAPIATRAGETENWERIRSMPREQRVLLSEKLRDFDRLGHGEKAAVESLDAKIAAEETSAQANYRTVLRRYHLWVQSLPEEKRNRLQSTPPDQRMALVAKLRAEERASGGKRSNPLFLQLIGPSPFLIAQRLKLWAELSDEEKQQVRSATDGPARLKILADLGRKKRIKALVRLTPSEEESLSKAMDTDARLKDLASLSLKRVEGKKAAQMRAHLAENYQFIVSPPKPVDPKNLLLFESDMPPGYRALFDPFPPEEAKRRLTILYRLVYPHPAEISSPALKKKPTAVGKTPLRGGPTGPAVPKRAPGPPT